MVLAAKFRLKSGGFTCEGQISGTLDKVGLKEHSMHKIDDVMFHRVHLRRWERTVHDYDILISIMDVINRYFCDVKSH